MLQVLQVPQDRAQQVTQALLAQQEWALQAPLAKESLVILVIQVPRVRRVKELQALQALQALRA